VIPNEHPLSPSSIVLRAEGLYLEVGETKNALPRFASPISAGGAGLVSMEVPAGTLDCALLAISKGRKPRVRHSNPCDATSEHSQCAQSMSLEDETDFGRKHAVMGTGVSWRSGIGHVKGS